jgi:hypothetical protein
MKVITLNGGGLMDVLACNIGHDGRSKACHEKSAEVIVGMRKHREGPNN